MVSYFETKILAQAVENLVGMLVVSMQLENYCVFDISLDRMMHISI